MGEGYLGDPEGNKVAFLRAINVNGRHMIRMAELRSLAGRLGWQEVRTVLQTGNVLFRSGDRRVACERALSEAFRTRYQWNIEVMARTESDIESAMKACPLDPQPGQLCVIFLKEAPAPDRVMALDAKKSEDVWALDGSTIYIRYEQGLHASPYSVAYFERHLKVPGTLRNWRTLARIRDAMGSGQDR